MTPNTFKTISPDEIRDNPFTLIGKDWMLITAGAEDGFNTMTGAWGGLGILWQKQVCFCVIRPTRHTYDFMEKSDLFTLSFLKSPSGISLLTAAPNQGAMSIRWRKRASPRSSRTARSTSLKRGWCLYARRSTIRTWRRIISWTPEWTGSIL